MNRIISITAAGMIGFTFPMIAGEWSPSDTFMIESTAKQLRDRPSDQIARHLNHPYPLAATGAAVALAEKGDDALPIIARFVVSERPEQRAGGALTLVQMLPKATQGSGPPDLSLALKKVIESAVKTLEQPDVAAHSAHAELATRLGHDMPMARRIALRMTDTDDAEVRAAGLKLTMDRIRDQGTCAKIARKVLIRDKGNTPRHYSWAGKIALKTGDAGAECLDAAARYLAERAHSQRGMFTDSAMNNWFILIKNHAQQPGAIDTVPGIVRCHLRLPQGTHPGWIKANALCLEALKAIGPDAAPLILKEVEQQMVVLAAMEDKEIDFLQTNRDRITQQEQALRELAKALQSE